MIESIARAFPLPAGFALRQLLNPALTEATLATLGERSTIFAPLLHHTVSVTMVQSGDKINVIPSKAEAGLDGRLLPGYQSSDVLNELHAVVGPEVELEVIRYDLGPAQTEMGLFDMLAAVLRKGDPLGEPVPLLLGAVTDGRFFSRLGIQTYGFLPMRLPPDFNFAQTLHAADKRIPAEALAFGAQAIYSALQRFGSA